MNHPEFLKALQKRHFLSQRKKEGAKDTKLDVDDTSLCVLSASLCFLCENHVALGLFLKIRDDELFNEHYALKSTDVLAALLLTVGPNLGNIEFKTSVSKSILNILSPLIIR